MILFFKIYKEIHYSNQTEVVRDCNNNFLPASHFSDSYNIQSLMTNTFDSDLTSAMPTCNPNVLCNLASCILSITKKSFSKVL